ncbi:MAG: Maf family nucleotide pyrophosphatase [Flavobacteriales bacterium]|jgi:septum formation protein|nr:Maf family nucleotide pyrophosphatase [Flavobacteriales bacterium]
MINEKLEKLEFILGSKSPRRQELLKKLIPEFKTIVKPVKEIYDPTLSKHEIATCLSDLKSSVFNPKNNELVITADTIVSIDNEILGKPKNENEAFSMLNRLSGKTHEVITGVTLKTKHKKETFHDTTQVTFYNLSPLEINFYIEKYKPFDKAGSYGIQEWMGYFGISKISGDYFNVMGLPLHLIYRKLNSF